MGINNIPTATDGTTIPSADHNAIKEALSIDNVPRNTDGEAVANAGKIGTTAFPWERANITAGYFAAGIVMPFHDYNGAIPIPQGWLKCTGQLINETNYDATHGGGSWAQFIGTSPLDGKLTPNLTNKYIVGSTTTTADGTVTIPSVGNNNSEITTPDHSHTVNDHNHKWFAKIPGVANNDRSHNVNGSQIDIQPDVTPKNLGVNSIAVSNGTGSTVALSPDQNLFTNNDSPGTSSDGSFTQNIQPESIQFQQLIRII